MRGDSGRNEQERVCGYAMPERTTQQCVVDLDDLVENVEDLIQSVRPDGSFLYVNRAWCSTLGYRRDEVAHLSVFDVIHPSSRSHCEEVFRRVLVGETFDSVEATLVTKDGRAVVVEASVNCRFQDGQPVATRTILRNITERKRAEAALQENERLGQLLIDSLRESEQRYRSLVELAHDATG